MELAPARIAASSSPRIQRLDAAASLIDRITLWVVCLGGFGLPLVYFWDTYERFVLPKVLFARVLLVVLLALLAVRWAAAGSITLRRTPLDLPLLAFLASALVSTIFAVNSNVAIFGMYFRWEGLLTLGTYAGLFWLAAQTVWRSDRARTLVRSMLASAYLVSIFAVLQWVIVNLTLVPPSWITEFSYGGVARAFATLSNPTMLGAFLAMLLPFAAYELFEGRSLTSKILAGNAAFMMTIALTLTFARSAWLGAVAGLVIAIAAPQRTPLRLRLGLSGAALAVLLAVLTGGIVTRGGLPLIPSLLQRAVSVGGQGSGLARLHVWQASVRLVSSRILVGYGPDTFGLVYPRFRTDPCCGAVSVVDKAHSEPLQIASTQGIPGLVSYMWILGATGLAFWRGRRNQGAAAAIGGVVAYQLWAQANFSWFPAAAPYWLYLAAAVAVWAVELPEAYLVRLPRLPALAVAVLLGLTLIGLGATGAAREWSADAYYYRGYGAEARGDLVAARTALAQARALAPEQGRYAMEAGRLAVESNEVGQAHWLAAQEAYSDAARLGTYHWVVYYNLAVSDLQLNRRADAIAALRRALELSPGEPAVLALLGQVSGP